jgi:hypothetical protein
MLVPNRPRRTPPRVQLIGHGPDEDRHLSKDTVLQRKSASYLTMSPVPAQRRPLVVSLGEPRYVGEDFLKEFKQDFDFEVIELLHFK